MKLILTILLLTCVSGLCSSTAAQVPGTAEVAAAGTADGTRFLQKEPALTGDRRPLYRLRKSDVIDIRFTFSPEYDQAVTVQPDGFIAIKAAGTVFAEGLTLPEVTAAVRQAYDFMRDPQVSITLKDFEKPSFLASGQLGRPGKYELRSRTTVTEGIAIAGGFTELSKHSQVVLTSRLSGCRRFAPNIWTRLFTHSSAQCTPVSAITTLCIFMRWDRHCSHIYRGFLTTRL